MNETPCTPDAATSNRLGQGITDKKGYAHRWGFSPRHIDNLIAMGLPHLKIGPRRVRIIIEEGDSWMRSRFAMQRRPAARNITT
jgi:hypothetical protein